jgi:hypothetical protein
MAAITFHAAQRGTRLQALVAGLRRMLDAFVSYRMRKATAEAEHGRSQQV